MQKSKEIQGNRTAGFFFVLFCFVLFLFLFFLFLPKTGAQTSGWTWLEDQNSLAKADNLENKEPRNEQNLSLGGTTMAQIDNSGIQKMQVWSQSQRKKL